MNIDLKTNYLGMQLDNPIIVAACPLTRECHRVEQLEQSGAAAVVMYSLFAEQVLGDPIKKRSAVSTSMCGGVSVMPLDQDHGKAIDAYLKNIELTSRSVSIPVIGSLNGARPGEWTQFAGLIEQAGAKALELNVYFVPTNPELSSEDVEEEYLGAVKDVLSQINIPLSVKLSPFFSSLPNFARQLTDAGVAGLVLFNRFMQPDIDIETFEVAPRLTLSSSSEMRLPLRWIAILRSQLEVSLAASSGAHSAEDAAKFLLAGADVVAMASALLKNGPGHIRTVLDDLTDYMQRKGVGSVSELRGLATRRCPYAADAYERANYIKSIVTYNEE